MKKLLLSLLLPVSLWAADQRTSELSGGLNQPIEHWQFSSAANRTGATGFFSQDIGKLGYQIDTGKYYRLISVIPTWQMVPDAPVTFTITDSGTGTTPIPVSVGHTLASGTPVNNFGVTAIQALADDTKTPNFNIGNIVFQYSNATHASSSGNIYFQAATSGVTQTVAIMSGAGGLSIGAGTSSVAPAGVLNLTSGITVSGGANAGSKCVGNAANLYVPVAQASNQAAPTNPTGTLSTTGV